VRTASYRESLQAALQHRAILSSKILKREKKKINSLFCVCPKTFIRPFLAKSEAAVHTPEFSEKLNAQQSPDALYF
jgi:hypothetical protein